MLNPYRSNRSWRARARRGFTLIELLLVVVILAILAGIVVPRFTARAEQARNSAAKTDIANIETALKMFEIDCGRYPTSEEGLRALLEAPANAKGWQRPYLEKGLPVDPWGNPYLYRCPGQHNPDGFDLYSCGPSGQEGGADNVVNWTQK